MVLARAERRIGFPLLLVLLLLLLLLLPLMGLWAADATVTAARQQNKLTLQKEQSIIIFPLKEEVVYQSERQTTN